MVYIQLICVYAVAGVTGHHMLKLCIMNAIIQQKDIRMFAAINIEQ